MELNKEKNFASAVVYCYNDVKTIGSFIENLDKTLAANFLKYEIIVVNDYSTDESVEIVKRYAAHKDSMVITVLNMSHYQGVEKSMNAGVDLSIGDFVYEFDFAYADFDWSLLMQVYHHSLKGYDIVSAKNEEKPQLSSRLFYKIFNKYSQIENHISAETFHLLSRRAINRIHSVTQNVPFRRASYAYCGLKLGSIVYQPVDRVIHKVHGDRRAVAVETLVLYTDVAYRTSKWLAVVMALASVIVAIYALVYSIVNSPVDSWLLAIIFMGIGFCGLFVVLAMVLKYLQTLVGLSFRTKKYLFESIEKLQ